MNFDYNPRLESKNFVDGVNFTCQDSCIWNVYPPGASGDLLASIINCHYGRTGCNYFGINNHGQVIFRPSDYKITNIKDYSRSYVGQQHEPLFDDQFFYDIAESLGQRQVNYSICDQFIFSCHLYQNHQINDILDKFPKCKIIRTYLADQHGVKIANFMSKLKNNNIVSDIKLSENQTLNNKLIFHTNVFNIPFGVLFNKRSYYKWYDLIIKFLNLNGRLICFDYIKYYISKQHPKIQDTLISYRPQS